MTHSPSTAFRPAGFSMKRAHLQALSAALGGQAQLVASLHVLSRPVLDTEDHAFLSDHAGSLHAIDLLRWLARCPADGPRALIVGHLADEALRRPARFEAEVLGARLDFLGEDDWAELLDRVLTRAPRSLSLRLLQRTSGAAPYRALLASRPAAAPDLCLHARSAEPFPSLAAPPAPGPSAAALDLARALFPRRNDEQACLAALRASLRAPQRAPENLLALARAGLLDSMEDPACALPGQVRFSREHGEDEEQASRDAALRSLAAHGLGEAGLAWLALQVEQALARGVPLLALLDELCPAAIRALWPRCGALRAAVDAERGRGEPRRSQALRRLLPPDLADGLLLAPWETTGASPEELLAGARERLRRSMDGGECVDLLGWLERHDEARAALLDLAAGALRRGVEGNDLLAWVASRMSTRTSWEKHGLPVLGALLERGAWSALSDLFAQCWSGASGGDRCLTPDAETSAGPSGATEAPAETSAGFREAVHGAFAAALLQQTKAALAAGQEAAALRALSAMACLDPPSRFNSALHEALRRCPPGPVAELLGINAGLVKHGNGRGAGLQGLISAIHVLSAR